MGGPLLVDVLLRAAAEGGPLFSTSQGLLRPEGAGGGPPLPPRPASRVLPSSAIDAAECLGPPTDPPFPLGEDRDKD